jgi:hypothetical protein
MQLGKNSSADEGRVEFAKSFSIYFRVVDLSPGSNAL